MNSKWNMVFEMLGLLLSLDLMPSALTGLTHNGFPFFSRMARCFYDAKIPPKLLLGVHNTELWVEGEQ